MNTYVNWTGAKQDFTMNDIVEAMAKVRALGPPPDDDITVAPDLQETAIRLNAEFRTDSPLVSTMRVWVDTGLPPGTWHPGKPLKERLREELSKVIPIFPRLY